MFTKFLTISNHLSKNKFSNEERYSEVKQKAVDYQTSKAQLIEALYMLTAVRLDQPDSYRTMVVGVCGRGQVAPTGHAAGHASVAVAVTPGVPVAAAGAAGAPVTLVAVTSGVPVAAADAAAASAAVARSNQRVPRRPSSTQAASHCAASCRAAAAPAAAATSCHAEADACSWVVASRRAATADSIVAAASRR